MKPDVSRFVKAFAREISEKNAAIFVGAGFSAPAGFVDWRELLRPIADDLDLNVDLESDLVAVAQFAFNRSGRHGLNQRLIAELGIAAEPTTNHRLLARLPIFTYWTTNYDTLIEDALKEHHKVVDIKYAVPHLALTTPRRDAIVYKMHGDIQNPHDAVLIREDYERYQLERAPFVTALSGDLLSKTFLFVGFSFTDPNLEYILSRIRLSLGSNQRTHYAFFRRRTKQPSESEEEFAHGTVRQTLMIEDLRRYGIKSLLVDDYAEITEALQSVVDRFTRQTVFVSGSAATFQPWGEEEVTHFMAGLGEELVTHGYRVATGLGSGIGNALLSGMISKIQQDAQLHLDDAAILRPFPLAIADRATREQAWSKYRVEMVEPAGTCLFLFGTKKTKAGVIDADGVVKEFEIAREQGKVLLPVGATGGAARSLWNTISRSFDEYFPHATQKFRQTFESLGDEVDSLFQLHPKIMNAIQLVVRGEADGKEGIL